MRALAPAVPHVVHPAFIPVSCPAVSRIRQLYCGGTTAHPQQQYVVVADAVASQPQTTHQPAEHSGHGSVTATIKTCSAAGTAAELPSIRQDQPPAAGTTFHQGTVASAAGSEHAAACRAAGEGLPASCHEPGMQHPSEAEPSHAVDHHKQQHVMQTHGIQQHQWEPEGIDSAVEYQKDISRSLRSHMCTSLAQLSDILSEHGPSMDGHSITASFTAVARLAKVQQAAGLNISQEQQNLAVALLEQQLLPLLYAKMHQLDAVGLQITLYALASLHYRQEATMLQLEAAVTPVAHQLPPGRLAQLMWSLGQLGLKPQPQLLRHVLLSSSRSMSFMHGRDLAQLLHGLVQLELEPPAAWLDMCCARVLQLCVHQQLEARALCSIFHSLARLVSEQDQHHQEQQALHQHQQQQQPAPEPDLNIPHPLLQSLLQATQQALQHAAAIPCQQQDQCGGVEVQSLPQARGQQAQQQCQPRQQLVGASQAPLNAPPMAMQPEDVLQQHRQQCVRPHPHQQESMQRPSPSPQPPQQHQQMLLQQQQQQLLQTPPEVLNPAGLNTLADVLRLLKTDPPPDWQAAYVAAAEHLMHAGDPRNVPLMLAPLVRWRMAPGELWLQQYLEACEGLMPDMQAQGLAVLGHSLAAQRVEPSAAWLHTYLAAADSTRLASTPAGCSFLMHTLGTWQQLGCLHSGHTGAAAALEAPAVNTSAVDQQTASLPMKASVLQHPSLDGAAGSQEPSAAAAGQQLEALARGLAGQCVRCFMDAGHSFTREQLGMFCKGLALWGLKATPQLADRLQQVVLQQLSCQFGPAGRRQRWTTATLCNVLMAMAVSCPSAATPTLLSRLWAVWSAWLLPSTTPTQAAALAWVSARLRLRPPQHFVEGLLQQLATAAGEVQLQHLAAVVLQAKRGCWDVQQQHIVVVLLDHLLLQQATELSALQQACVTAAVQQQQQPRHSGRQDGGWPGADLQEGLYSRVKDASTAGMCTSSAEPKSSRSVGGPAAARLFGLANHRLKVWMTAAAAVAAWCDALSPQQLQTALRMYSACAAMLPQPQRCELEAHLDALRASWRACSSSSSGATNVVAAGCSRSLAEAPTAAATAVC